jgi:hypothetical protein
MKNWLQIKENLIDWREKTKEILGEIFVPQDQNDYLPKVLKSRYLFWYGAAILLIKIALISLVLVLPSTDFYSAITAQHLAYLINQVRQENGLAEVSFNSQLNSAAELKAYDMANYGYFEHISPTGTTPWHWFKKAGYNFEYAGENLAMDFSQTDDVFSAWMNSPSHRANILNPNYQEIGLAVKTGEVQSHNATLAVLVFGSQAKTKAIAQTNQSDQPKTTAPSAFVTTPMPTKKIIATPNPIPPVNVSPSAPPAVFIAANETSPSPTSQISLKTSLGTEAPVPASNKLTQAPAKSSPAGRAPQVLGAFISKSDEMAKSLYLYFTLFLAMALLVNIFVKIRIQRWPTIFATTFIIVLSVVLIFI